MTAAEKFKEGQRVRMTPEALKQSLHGHRANRRTGAVKGFVDYAPVGDPANPVRILRDGERTAKTYHMDFWEADTDAA